MTSPADPPAVSLRAGHRVLPVAVAALLAGTLLTGAGAVWAARDTTPDVNAVAAVEPVPVPAPVLTAVAPSGPRTAAAWDAPLTLVVAAGTLRDITVLDPDGVSLAGTLEVASWRSVASSLLPAASYRVTAALLDAAGAEHPLTLTVRTSPATSVLHATLSPGDGAVVGVGQPVIVRLDRPVIEGTDRALLVQRLQVATTPPVQGGWRWMADDELHYRPPTYWAAGTRVSVAANLHRLQLSAGTWGSGRRTTTYRVGDAMVSTVDVKAYTMTVRRNGKVLRVLKVSTGSAKFPTHNGAHLVLEKTKLKTMDSSTIGIPRNGPGGYFLKVPNSVRISYSGEFVHSAPGTVRQQGVANVSHGCVNLSPADAAWFYGLAKRGDVVDVIGSPLKPLSYDPGTSDWNMPFSAWVN